MKLHNSEIEIAPMTPDANGEMTAAQILAQTAQARKKNKSKNSEEEVLESQEVEVGYLDTKYELTDEIKEAIKSRIGKRAKKVTLLGHTFVFLCANRGEWIERIDNWRERMEYEKKTITQEMDDRNFIDAFVIFPSLSTSFRLPTENDFYWSNLPAGIQPRLARLIEFYAGWLNAAPELIKDEDFSVEDLFLEDVVKERPTEEELFKVKELTDMPCRLVKFVNDWFVVRALRWREAKFLWQKRSENPNDDHMVKLLKDTVIYGPKNYEELPAGVVPFLNSHVMQVSGLSTDGEDPIVPTEAEDL